MVQQVHERNVRYIRNPNLDLIWKRSGREKTLWRGTGEIAVYVCSMKLNLEEAAVCAQCAG